MSRDLHFFFVDAHLFGRRSGDNTQKKISDSDTRILVSSTSLLLQTKTLRHGVALTGPVVLASSQLL